MGTYEIAFDGAVLQRGFWLYVWMITTPSDDTLIYVGRTGDTSSPNAQSPFRRVGQHVDPNPKAKSNALARHLHRLAIRPEECGFRFITLGPIFDECGDMVSHKPIRDRIAAIERRAADWFRCLGYRVLGSHPRSRDVEPGIWDAIERELSARFSVTKHV